MLRFLLGMLGRSRVQRTLEKHFRGLSLSTIVTAARDFPVTSRVDVHAALDQMLTKQPDTRVVGIHSQMGHETPTLAHLFTRSPFPIELAPLQHDEVDVGDPEPVRCLANGLWLSRKNALPFAVLLSPSMQFGRMGGVHVEIAVPAGETGAQFSQDFFRDLERRVGAGQTYRGRIISLESYQDYSGRGGAVKVHRLRVVHRIEMGGDHFLQQAAVDAAIEEMVFVGGSLNLTLLGGSATALAGPARS
jgi:hypothetical protein